MLLLVVLVPSHLNTTKDPHFVSILERIKPPPPPSPIYCRNLKTNFYLDLQRIAACRGPSFQRQQDCRLAQEIFDIRPGDDSQGPLSYCFRDCLWHCYSYHFSGAGKWGSAEEGVGGGPGGTSFLQAHHFGWDCRSVGWGFGKAGAGAEVKWPGCRNGSCCGTGPGRGGA